MGRQKGFDRNEVLDAAIQLFWKKGYADTSLSDLEKATGVNKSGLYSEFKDKDDILLESIQRFCDTTPKNEILKVLPLGWKNIEMFLKSSTTCKGQKGCYLANNLRDFAIIPTKAKNLIDEYNQIVRKGLIENLKATGTKKDIELLTNLIMTFGAGMSLKLNAVKPESLLAEVDGFLEMLKK
jgi:AcrR family transcriptional regulator